MVRDSLASGIPDAANGDIRWLPYNEGALYCGLIGWPSKVGSDSVYRMFIISVETDDAGGIKQTKPADLIPEDKLFAAMTFACLSATGSGPH